MNSKQKRYFSFAKYPHISTYTDNNQPQKEIWTTHNIQGANIYYPNYS